ncbi:MAG: cell division protein FtsZ [bacterium]
MPYIKPQSENIAKIKVVGVGGGGGNAIDNMIKHYSIEGVEFIAINTDAQALMKNTAEVKVRIGEELTRGLGSGGNPSVGKKAAEESSDMLHEHLAGSDMVFVTAGMGGGTGSGAAPTVASIAKGLGALTVGVVTKPFDFEGKRRMQNALGAIEEMKDKVDTLIVVPNQRLLDLGDRSLSFPEAMKKVDDVLGQAVKSISNLVTQTGLINVDFADVKAVMTDAGTAIMGMGEATGEDRAIEAAKMAVNSPLLEISIDGATGVLFNVIGGPDLKLEEVDEAALLINQVVDPDANIIFGATIDENMKDSIRITVLATGFKGKNMKDILEPKSIDSFRSSQDDLNSANNQNSANTASKFSQSSYSSRTSLFGKKKEQTPPNFASSSNAKSDNGGDDEEYDNTPAFLRRK